MHGAILAIVAALGGVDHPSVVTIRQANEDKLVTTLGAVVRADQTGTYILTCRHKRRQAIPWTAAGRAGVVAGRVSAFAPNADLAILWTSQRWPGPVLGVAARAPAMPLAVVNDPCLPPAPFPLGRLMYTGAKRAATESGCPMLTPCGLVCGVLSANIEDCAVYTPRPAVEQFLQSQMDWRVAR